MVKLVACHADRMSDRLSDSCDFQIGRNGIGTDFDLCLFFSIHEARVVELADTQDLKLSF